MPGGRNYSNTAVETTLNGAITNVATSLTVTSDVGFPAVPFTIQCESEVILVTARTGTNFSTVTRGYDGTSAVAHADASTVKHVVIAEDFDKIAPVLLGFQTDGALSTGTGTKRFYMPDAFTVTAVHATIMETAPTGAAVIVDVNKNGTTIFTTQGNRPSIAASAFTDFDNTPDVTAYAQGDYLTYDIDQVGSTVAGTGLIVMVEGYWG